MALKDEMKMTTINEGKGVFVGCLLALLLTVGLTFLLLAVF